MDKMAEHVNKFTNSKTWNNAKPLYPAFCDESVTKQFANLNWKADCIPEKFLHHCKLATSEGEIVQETISIDINFSHYY